MNQLFTLIKFIMGLKVWMIVGMVGGGIVLISLIKNVITGSFSVGKFASGFNIFTGSVQGKLIYYGLILILAFGLYHQLTRATTNYDTDYKNNVHHNNDVIIDQRLPAQNACSVNLFWGAIKLGCKQEAVKKTVNNNYKESK